MSLSPSNFNINDFRRVVVLSGAGVSVASGLGTFRDESGDVLPSMPPDWLWASDARNLPASLDRLWDIYGSLRGQADAAAPNAAHLGLARWEQVLAERGGEFALVTQNVDELHQKAGSRNVLELHGSLLRSRCTDESCANATPFRDARAFTHAPPCEIRGQPLRPDIVLFGEPLEGQVLGSAGLATIRCDLFVALGTSATVAPASKLAERAARYGAATVFINPARHQPDNFSIHIRERAEDAIPRLLSGLN
jgi:NAD-dependent deacetylase